MKLTTAALHATFIAVFAVTASHIDSRPADAAVIKQGEVCKRNNDHCITIGPGDNVPFTVKSYTFVAPTAGTALVSFHGTMQCVNDASVDDTLHGIIDLTTQIVIGAETPSFQAPGGQRHAMRLAPPGISTTRRRSTWRPPASCSSRRESTPSASRWCATPCRIKYCASSITAISRWCLCPSGCGAARHAPVEKGR